MVVNPVAVAWDERGRMYVVEDRGYPSGSGNEQNPIGQIVRLESSHNDGHYDKRTVFADGLAFPNGIMCWKGGVFVTCAPYLYYFKDTNCDGIADIKQIVFKGFQDLSTTQLRVNNPVLNVDNWIYLNSGLTDAKVSSPLYPDHPAVVRQHTGFRFRPDTDQFGPAAGVAQFGETFDDFGRKFVCPNTTSFAQESGSFTSACGIYYYHGDALPEEYHNNSFTCEPAGNLVHRDIISPTNATFTARRARDGAEFLASPDNWFRPVNLASGPDGALYVCDMYRKTIEHPDSLPEANRKATDFNSGNDKGRIYRITAIKSESKPKKVDLAHATVERLCKELNNRDGWWRATAQRLLLERHDIIAIAYLQSLGKHAKMPETRVLAVHILEGIDALDDQRIEQALNDPDPRVRENGIQLAESRLKKSPRLAARVLAIHQPQAKPVDESKN